MDASTIGTPIKILTQLTKNGITGQYIIIDTRDRYARANSTAKVRIYYIILYARGFVINSDGACI